MTIFVMPIFLIKFKILLDFLMKNIYNIIEDYKSYHISMVYENMKGQQDEVFNI